MVISLQGQSPLIEQTYIVILHGNVKPAFKKTSRKKPFLPFFLLEVIADVEEGGRKIEGCKLKIYINEVAFYLSCEQGDVLKLDEFFGGGGDGEYMAAAVLPHYSQGYGRYDAISAVGIFWSIFAGVVYNAYAAVIYLPERVTKGGIGVKTGEFAISEPNSTTLIESPIMRVIWEARNFELVVKVPISFGYLRN
ncbi:MAG: hypothetical protein NT118_09045 [Lentisphaerae bacterium]|nr:hypothetical protein [Lentisphaerota bacterium]